MMNPPSSAVPGLWQRAHTAESVLGEVDASSTSAVKMRRFREAEERLTTAVSSEGMLCFAGLACFAGFTGFAGLAGLAGFTGLDCTDESDSE